MKTYKITQIKLREKLHTFPATVVFNLLCAGAFLFGGSAMASQIAGMALMNPKHVHHVTAPSANFSVKIGIALTRASSVMAMQTALTIQMRMLLCAVCH